MVNENVEAMEEKTIYQVDSVVAVKKYLEEGAHNPRTFGPTGDQKHAQGIGSRQISKLLGEKNWGETKVRGLLKIHNDLHPDIVKDLMNHSSGNDKKEER